MLLAVWLRYVQLAGWSNLWTLAFLSVHPVQRGHAIVGTGLQLLSTFVRLCFHGSGYGSPEYRSLFHALRHAHRHFFFSRACETTACRDSNNMARTMSFLRQGIRRSHGQWFWPLRWLCRVPARWPVSAAVKARRMVSRSRISPTRIISGSSRNAERNASLKPCVSRCTSRWLIRHFLDWCTKFDRIFDGQNMVIAVVINIIQHRRQGGWFTRTGRTCHRYQTTWIFTDVFKNLSRTLIFKGQDFRMVRNTAPAPRFWLNALTRKRATPDTSKEVSFQIFFKIGAVYRSWCHKRVYALLLCSNAGRLMRRTSPSTRIIGGKPADKCKSDAPFLAENANNSVISIRSPSSLKC